MKIYSTLLITLTLSSFTNSFGQNVTIKGRLLDKETKQPVIYAIAEIKALKTGAYSDSAGVFTMSVPERCLDDTIELSSLGYEGKQYLIKNFAKAEAIIELKPVSLKLKEVVVFPHKIKTIRLGITAQKPISFQIANIFGGQCGHYIKNKSKKPGYVKAVSFYIAKAGFTEAPFRIRIYKRDKKNDCPGEDLLHENVIVSSDKGEGWFTVDMSKYGIEFPADGMFVMMEWVYSGDKYYYEIERPLLKEGKEEMHVYHVYGQSLGNVNKQPGGGFWGRGLGDKWNQWNKYHKGYWNVMINADIAYKVK